MIKMQFFLFLRMNPKPYNNVTSLALSCDWCSQAATCSCNRDKYNGWDIWQVGAALGSQKSTPVMVN